MRPKIIGLTSAIQRVLEGHSNAISWKNICEEIKDGGLVVISPEQEEITYGQPNFHHSVRRILCGLVKRREVNRPSRGMYKIAVCNENLNGGIL